MKKNAIFIFLLMGIISGITGIILGLITHYLSKFDYYIVTNYPNSTSFNTTNTSLDITVTSSPIEINTSTIKNDLENGKTDKAYNEAKNYFEKHPNDYWGCQLLGNSLFQLQNYSEAITIFQKCITLAPSKNELGIIYDLISKTYISQNNLQSAEQYATLAIQNNPNYSPAYNTLALIYYKNKKFEEAIKYFTKALILLSNKDDYTSFFNKIVLNLNLVQSYYNLKDYSQAQKYLKITQEMIQNNTYQIPNILKEKINDLNNKLKNTTLNK